jgi:hypothetical protein
MVGTDPVLQVRCKAGLNVVQQRSGDNEPFISESLVEEFVDFLELGTDLLVDIGLRHLVEKVLVQIDQQFLTSLAHYRNLAACGERNPKLCEQV